MWDFKDFIGILLGLLRDSLGFFKFYGSCGISEGFNRDFDGILWDLMAIFMGSVGIFEGFFKFYGSFGISEGFNGDFDGILWDFDGI